MMHLGFQAVPCKHAFRSLGAPMPRRTNFSACLSSFILSLHVFNLVVLLHSAINATAISCACVPSKSCFLESLSCSCSLLDWDDCCCCTSCLHVATTWHLYKSVQLARHTHQGCDPACNYSKETCQAAAATAAAGHLRGSCHAGTSGAV